MRRLAALVTAMVLAPQGHACDAARGAAVFAKCAICHSRSAGEPSPVGPHLGGLAGRPAASVPG